MVPTIQTIQTITSGVILYFILEMFSFHCIGLYVNSVYKLQYLSVCMSPPHPSKDAALPGLSPPSIISYCHIEFFAGDSFSFGATIRTHSEI